MATAAQHRAEIDRINTEVAAQAAKIAQLSTILDGKAGGGGGASVETCTVIIDASPSVTQRITLLQYTTVDSDGNVTEGIIKNVADNAYPVSITCVCNTPISGILPYTQTNHADDTYPIRCYLIVRTQSADLAFLYGLVTLEKSETGTFVY